MAAVVVGVAAGYAASFVPSITLGAIISIGFSAAAATSSYQSSRAARKALSEGTPASERKQMLRASNGPMVGILGRSEISGTLFFAEEVKSESQLHLCVALCGPSLDEGEPVIAGCHRIMMDDVEIPCGGVSICVWWFTTARQTFPRRAWERGGYCEGFIWIRFRFG